MRKAGVRNTLPFRKRTASACLTLGNGVNTAPGWLPDLYCTLPPPTIVAT